MGRSAVSLDLGSTGVRAALFTPGKTPTVHKVAFMPLQRGIIEAGKVRDPQALAEALKGMWAQHKFGTKHVHFAVGNSQVEVRQADLAWLPPKEFTAALPYIAPDYINIPTEDLALDYHVLTEYDAPRERATEDDPETQRFCRVLLVGTDKKMLDGHISAIRQAGLLPLRADLVPFALIHGAALTATEEGTAEALVDIGADITTIVIHQNGQPRFVRIVPDQGGNYITDALIERFGWSVNDAEATKIELGLNTGLSAAPALTQSVFGVDTAPVLAVAEHPAQPVINQAAAKTVAEIRQSLDFFLNSAPDVDSLSRVCLTGGASMLKGLAQRLASELRTKVEYGQPFASVNAAKVNKPEHLNDQQWAVALGLVMGASR